MTENEILGFNPSQLDVFKESNGTHNAGNSLIYKTRIVDAKSEDGVYRSTIKVIYNPFNLTQSVLEQQSYALQDERGWFTVVSSLTVNDTSCPIFKAWKKCHYAEEGSMLWKQAAKKEQGGFDIFDKRFGRYVTIQVLSDKNHPELEGKYMLWKLPKSIWDLINSKMNPSKESNKASIPVMDFLFGRAIDLEVIPGPDDRLHPERKTRETKYRGELSEDVVSCTNPDGSPLLNSEEQDVLDLYVMKLSKIWREKDPAVRASLEDSLRADEVSSKLRTIYTKVLNDIKKVCPNLVEELGYKPWDEATSARVQKWIDVVLSGNNPATLSNAPEAAAAIDTNGTPASSPATPTEETHDPLGVESSEVSDDLPF